jgi:hypothetical protein
MIDYHKMARTLSDLGAYASHTTDLIAVRPKSAHKVFAVKETGDKRFDLWVQNSEEPVPMPVLSGESGYFRVGFKHWFTYTTFNDATVAGLWIVDTKPTEYQQICEVL